DGRPREAIEVGRGNRSIAEYGRPAGATTGMPGVALRVWRGGECSDFGACCRDELAVCVGLTMQAPTTVRCLGDEYPRPVGNARITGGLGNERCEFGYPRELLFPVESAGVGEHLHSYVRVAAIHVGQHAGGDFVNESCSVL